MSRRLILFTLAIGMSMSAVDVDGMAETAYQMPTPIAAMTAMAKMVRIKPDFEPRVSRTLSSKDAACGESTVARRSRSSF